MPRRQYPTKPSHIDRDLFLKFRSPLRGATNPEEMTNPVWTWIIENNLGAYHANLAFDGPDPALAGPCWNWDRYGQTETKLPNGGTIYIGGEHEDSYDPDFYIYNDVVVRRNDGRIEIFGYAEGAFPPTDFHTANLVGRRIIVIGNLSYPELRAAKAQIFELNLESMRFDAIETSGDHPPWIHKHRSEIIENTAALLITGGEFDIANSPDFVENIDEWRLDLNSYRWERLTLRNWPRFAFSRSDREDNHLYWLRNLLSAQRSRRPRSWDYRDARINELGPNPRLDILETLYQPHLTHHAAPEDENGYAVFKIVVDGVVVRYKERSHTVYLTVEGDLPGATVEALRKDLHDKLGLIERASIDCTPLSA